VGGEATVQTGEELSPKKENDHKTELGNIIRGPAGRLSAAALQSWRGKDQRSKKRKQDLLK